MLTFFRPHIGHLKVKFLTLFFSSINIKCLIFLFNYCLSYTPQILECGIFTIILLQVQISTKNFMIFCVYNFVSRLRYFLKIKFLFQNSFKLPKSFMDCTENSEYFHMFYIHVLLLSTSYITITFVKTDEPISVSYY